MEGYLSGPELPSRKDLSHPDTSHPRLGQTLDPTPRDELVADRCRCCAPQETEDHRSRLLGTELFSGFGGRMSQPSRQCCGEQRLKAPAIPNYGKVPSLGQQVYLTTGYPRSPQSQFLLTLPKMDEMMWILMEPFPQWTWP